LLHAAIRVLAKVHAIDDDIAARHGVMQLAAARFLVECCLQPHAYRAQFACRQDALNPQHQTVFRRRRIVHLMLVSDQRCVDGAPMNFQIIHEGLSLA